MTEDDRLKTLLQAALPPSRDVAPVRDVWALIERRDRQRPISPWTDLGLAAGAALAIVVSNGWLWLICQF